MSYTIFRIPKRKGGERIIEAPDAVLKAKQQELIPILQKTFKVSPFAHAFTFYKNIVTMAMPHVGKKWVGCIDLEDFFPSIQYSKLIDIASCKDNKLKKNNNFRLYNEGNEQLKKEFTANYNIINTCFNDFEDTKLLRLPQGAPTSPLLSNIFMYSTDWKMAWKCFTYQCDYSRYADDLVVSGDNKKDVIKSLLYAEKLLNKIGLKVNHKKTKIMHRSKRQLVCGIVVNKKLNIPRKYRKNLRAEVHQQKLKREELRNDTKGKIAFRDMVLNNKKDTWSSSSVIKGMLFTQRMDMELKVKR